MGLPTEKCSPRCAATESSDARGGGNRSGDCGEVRERIAQARATPADQRDAIRLVLASKTQPPAAVRAAYAAGARDFGENYVQEARRQTRRAGATCRDATWHLIGHLQTNKARLAAAIFDLIQTLDSARLADALARAHPAPPMPVLIEVNLGGEASKSGVAPGDVEALIEAARATGRCARPDDDPAASAESRRAARRYFAQLRELRDRLAATHRPCAKRAFDGNDR